MQVYLLNPICHEISQAIEKARGCNGVVSHVRFSSFDEIAGFLNEITQ